MHWILQLMLCIGTLMIITGTCVGVAWMWATADTLIRFTVAIIATGIVLAAASIILYAITVITQEQ